MTTAGPKTGKIAISESNEDEISVDNNSVPPGKGQNLLSALAATMRVKSDDLSFSQRQILGNLDCVQTSSQAISVLSRDSTQKAFDGDVGKGEFSFSMNNRTDSPEHIEALLKADTVIHAKHPQGSI